MQTPTCPANCNDELPLASPTASRRKVVPEQAHTVLTSTTFIIAMILTV